MPISRVRRRSLLVAGLVAVSLTAVPVRVARANGERLVVCGFRLQSPHEMDVFASRLPAKDFQFVDLSPPPLLGQSEVPPAGTSVEECGGWIHTVCRRDVKCDMVVITAEFAGRFFGSCGRSLSLQEMEEASCKARCDGLFHDPREVFLLACNTLATKDIDMRGPQVYLQVLLDHGFDRAQAERVVAMRYGPLGPAFREALRRVFAGVPRIYGFASAAPKGEYTAPMLERYFDTVGDYRQHLERAAHGESNRALLAAFKGTSLVETTGLTDDEPAARDRDLICALYDESLPVERRLEIVRDLVARPDLLAFVPSIQVFIDRHPAEKMKGDERRLYDEIRANAEARERVRSLVLQLDVSALQLELGRFAVQMGWLETARFRQLAIDGTRQLLLRPLDNEVVDVVCEVPKHVQIGGEFRSADLPDALFRDPEGIRLVSCLAPPDQQVSVRLLAALDADDPILRVWAAHALSRRLPLPEPVLMTVLGHLNDPEPQVRDRLRWIFLGQRPLPRRVLDALDDRDAALAKQARAYARAAR
jgi:hypothetical protein